MKFLKFLGWSILGVILLAGFAFWSLPTLAGMAITQGLTSRGFENVSASLNYPSTTALTIHSLSFNLPIEFGSNSISIETIDIAYSLDSLLNNLVEGVEIERIAIAWDSSFLERSSPNSPSSPTSQSNSQFDLNKFGSGIPLPVLPFKYLHIKQVDITNPLAPSALQQISLNATIDAYLGKYEGKIQLDGEDLLLNSLDFSLNQQGTASLKGTHTSIPEDLLLELETSLEKSNSDLKLQGRAFLKLHPFIHTLTALYPLPPHYQSISGTFSGNWTGSINEKLSPSDSAIGPIQGDFSLKAQVPTWPPFAQDIQLQTQGTITVVDENITVTVQPTSSGLVTLAMNTFIPPAVESFIRHDDSRSVAWNIREPVEVETPITHIFETIHIPSAAIHMTVRNSSEQLDMLLSSKGLLLDQGNGVSGKAQATISTQLKPGPTSTWHPEKIYLEGNASIVLSPNQIAVSFNPSSYFHFSEMNTETLHIPTLISRFPQGAAATYLPDKKTLLVETTVSSLSIPSIFMQDQQLTFQKIMTKDLSIHNTPESWGINGNSVIKKIHVPFEAMKIPDSNWQTQYSVNPTSIAFQFQGETVEHPLQIGGQVRLNLLNGEGSGTMALKPMEFAPDTLVLSQLIQPWPNPDMDVTQGTVSASAKVTFRQSPSETSKSFHIKGLHGIVDFQEIGGFFKPTIMEGLTTRVEILGEDETLRIPSTPLHIKKVRSAVELAETSLLVSTKAFRPSSLPTFSITNMNTHLLGGTISLPDTIIDPLAPTHAVTLQVKGLDLGKILALEQQESVKGTGTLDGRLPLFVSGTDIEVHQGSITARPPGGTLQFEVDKETAAGWAKNQPSLDLIVKSLENYQYSKLEVGADYEKNGILKLATRLEGKNPDFKKGVPIHFNLNIEENIPALMKSLSLVKGLEESIEKMMAERADSAAQEKHQ